MFNFFQGGKIGKNAMIFAGNLTVIKNQEGSCSIETSLYLYQKLHLTIFLNQTNSSNLLRITNIFLLD